MGFVGEFIAEGKGDSFFTQAGSGAFLGHIFEELGEVVVGDFGTNLWGKGFEELVGIAGEHLVDPEMQIFHNDAPADAGMTPDEGG